MATLEDVFDAARDAYSKAQRTPGPEGNLYDALQAAIDVMLAKQMELAKSIDFESAFAFYEATDRRFFEGSQWTPEQIEGMKQRQAQITRDHEAAERKHARS